MGFQSSINGAIGTIAAAKIAADYEKDKKEEKITSTQTSLHIANDRVSQDEAALEEANKVADNMSMGKNKKGITQYRDKTTGKLIKRYDYEKAQTALKTAQEQVNLSTAIRDSFKQRLAKLTGGNK